MMLAGGNLLTWAFRRADARTFGRPARAGRRSDRVLTRVTRVVARLHTSVLRRSGWRVGARWMGGDVVLLTHRGRRSGQAHTTPLLHVRDGADVVVAASNGGIDREPQWWLNLQADPAAEVEIAGRRTAVTASRVEEPERARRWAALMATCGSYDGYQASVQREIAVVRLTPRDVATAD
jgi:deazaflavin-dependent oxidoreductase (nitroreductase family)